MIDNKLHEFTIENKYNNKICGCLEHLNRNRYGEEYCLYKRSLSLKDIINNSYCRIVSIEINTIKNGKVSSNKKNEIRKYLIAIAIVSQSIWLETISQRAQCLDYRDIIERQISLNEEI